MLSGYVKLAFGFTTWSSVEGSGEVYTFKES